MAKRHEALYRRFKANEAAQEITGPYRRLHPEDNNERQAIHEHGPARPSASGPPGLYPRSPSREALAVAPDDNRARKAVRSVAETPASAGGRR
jgi:hypothetical protein